jgi:hypothetical protein
MKSVLSYDVRQRVIGDQTRPHLVIGFCRRHGLGLVTRYSRFGSRWGHTALWDEERGVFNEALMFKGVIETPQRKWFDRWSEVELVAVPVPDPKAGIEFARSTVGKGYDYWGAWSVPFRGDWQSDHRWYCSERDTMAVHRSGSILFYDPKRGIHPHDLWRAVRR